jgi:hypothetical protein
MRIGAADPEGLANRQKIRSELLPVVIIEVAQGASFTE